MSLITLEAGTVLMFLSPFMTSSSNPHPLVIIPLQMLAWKDAKGLSWTIIAKTQA